MDSGVEAGSLVSVYYDSMLAKVIAWGETGEAIQRLALGAQRLSHRGLATNIDSANAILNHPAFGAGDVHGLHRRAFRKGPAEARAARGALHHMAMAATIVYHNRQNLTRESLKPMAAQVGSAQSPRTAPLQVRCGRDVFEICLRKDQQPHAGPSRVDGRSYEVMTPEFEFYRRRLRLKIDGQSHISAVLPVQLLLGRLLGMARVFEVFCPREWELSRHMPTPRDEALQNVLLCPMPGLVVDVRVKKGDRVHRGQDLVSIESMKMESFVASPCDAEVEEVLALPGQAVETDEVLVRFKL